MTQDCEDTILVDFEGSATKFGAFATNSCHLDSR
jgi:hypothetical protein